MPDISMCARGDCPLSRRCYRHADSGTRPSTWQGFIAPDAPAPNCGHYWPTREASAGTRPADIPNPDAPATVTAGVSVSARSDLCAPGATSTGTGA